MIHILLSALLLSQPAPAKAVSSRIQMPSLVSYDYLMRLTPVKRQHYLNRIAAALAKFEAGRNHKLEMTEQYADANDYIIHRWPMFALMFPEALAADNQNDSAYWSNSSHWSSGAEVLVNSDGSWEVRDNGKVGGPFHTQVPMLPAGSYKCDGYSNSNLYCLPNIPRDGQPPIRAQIPPANQRPMREEIIERQRAERAAAIASHAPAAPAAAAPVATTPVATTPVTATPAGQTPDARTPVQTTRITGTDNANAGPSHGFDSSNIRDAGLQPPATTAPAAPANPAAPAAATAPAAPASPANAAPAAPASTTPTATAAPQAHAAAAPASATPSQADQDARTKQANEKAAQCSKYDRKAMAKARKQYEGSKRSDPSCLIGGTDGKYSDGFKEGGCKNPDAEKACEASGIQKFTEAGQDASKAHFVECDKALFCDENKKSFCVQKNQKSIQSCYAHAANTKQVGDYKQIKKCENVTRDALKDKNTQIQNVCNRKGADVLFCFECNVLKNDVEDANVSVGAAPSGATQTASAVAPVPYLPSGSYNDPTKATH